MGQSLARTNWSGTGEQSGGIGSSSGNLLSTINQDAFAANYPAMSLTAEGYAQRDQMEAAGLIPSNSMPQMSFASNGNSSSGGNLEFSTNLPETPVASEMYQANATYHRGTDALETAAASDRAFYRDAESDATNGLSAVGWHIGGLLNETGYDLAKTARSAYRLVTDANTRATAYSTLKYAVNNPGVVVNGGIQGLRNFANKPFGEQADSTFKFAAGGLASVG